MQPYFLPYIGYWQLLNYVDVFILFDDVTYIKKGYIDRNYIANTKGTLGLKLKVRKASQNRKINDHELLPGQSHLWELVKTCYPETALEKDEGRLIELIIKCQEENLAKYLESSIRNMAQYLEINTEIFRSSDIKSKFVGKEKIISMVKHVSGTTYVNMRGGQHLYHETDFSRENLGLEFFDAKLRPYAQGTPEFTPGLSIVDLLLNTSRETIISDHLDIA